MDLADAHIKALNYLKAGNPSNIFNLGNGEGYSVLEIINAAKKKLQICLLQLQKAARRAGDPAKLVANNTKRQKKY